MKLVHRKPVLRLLAAFAILLFVGDLVADSVADSVGGHCDSEASQSAPDHEKAPCLGAVVPADFAMRLGPGLQPMVRLAGVDEARPRRLAGSIDHPPQLA